MPQFKISILVIPFTHGIYNYIPQTSHVPTVYTVAAVLYLHSVLHVMLFRPWNMFCTFTSALPVTYSFLWVILPPSANVSVVLLNSRANVQMAQTFHFAMYTFTLCRNQKSALDIRIDEGDCKFLQNVFTYREQHPKETAILPLLCFTFAKRMSGYCLRNARRKLNRLV